MNAHHIFPWRDFPEFRFDIDNGTCLCDECHINFHKIHGQSGYLNNWMNYEEDNGNKRKPTEILQKREGKGSIEKIQPIGKGKSNAKEIQPIGEGESGNKTEK